MNIIKKLFKKKSELKGKEIDFDNCWSLKKIKDREELLKKIIEVAPENSIWSIEGIEEKNIYEAISKHITTDNTMMQIGTIWPKQKIAKVLLTEIAKKEIVSSIPNWNLDYNITHQHIYKEDVVYFTSYDNLDPKCTWISNLIDKEDFKNLSEKMIIEFDDN
jgi:hypothetical protein